MERLAEKTHIKEAVFTLVCAPWDNCALLSICYNRLFESHQLPVTNTTVWPQAAVKDASFSKITITSNSLPWTEPDPMFATLLQQDKKEITAKKKI